MAVLKGPKALTFDQAPTRLMQLRGQSWPNPDIDEFLVPYRELVFASALYDTYAKGQIGAGQMITGDMQKKHLVKQVFEPQ